MTGRRRTPSATALTRFACCAVLVCTACGGAGGGAEGPVVPAPFDQKDENTVEYHVQGRLRHLLEVRCLADGGARGLLEGGGITSEQSSLRVNEKKLARRGVFVEVRRGGVRAREYSVWSWTKAGGSSGRIAFLLGEGLNSRQTGELSRERVVAKLREIDDHREVRPSAIHQEEWRDYLLDGELVVRLGQRFDSARGLPTMIVETERPLREAVHLKLRPAAGGGLRIETPLGESKCSRTVPRRLPPWY